jgi:hypothetical protein
MIRRRVVRPTTSDASNSEYVSIGLHPIRSWFLAFGAGSASGAAAVFFTAKLIFLVGLKRDLIDSGFIGMAMGFVGATAIVAGARATARPQGWAAAALRLFKRRRLHRVLFGESAQRLQRSVLTTEEPRERFRKV